MTPAILARRFGEMGISVAISFSVMDPVLPCQPCGWVAVLRPHAASAGHVTKATYSYLRGVYVRHGTKHVRAPRKRRTSENAVKRKFAVFHKSEVQLRRILILRTRVNKAGS